MLTLLNISNIALIDDLKVEFDGGLNLLTGETGSGKSIIVDALGLLIGGRFTSDQLKAGAERGVIEGMFSVDRNTELEARLAQAGIEVEGEGPQLEDAGRTLQRRRPFELIIRREVSQSSRNKIFINNHLATTALLRELHPFLVDIHGQGDQQTLFDPATHLDLLDSFAGTFGLRETAAAAYREWAALRRRLDDLSRNEAEKLQLADTIRFQIEELQRADLRVHEDDQLEEERRRLMNVEKLRTLGAETFALIYEDGDSALTRIKQAARRVSELSQFESTFSSSLEALESSSALLEDLSDSLRAFNDKLEFSPERLAEVESRLADLARLKRKYGGSIDSALEHLTSAESRLAEIDHAGELEAEIRNALEAARSRFLDGALKLSAQRRQFAEKFAKSLKEGIAEVAIEHAKFQVQVASPSSDEALNDAAGECFTPRGLDRVEFFFSANPGEQPRPLAKVASGGEASRLMLVLKTIAGATEFPRTIVFDEIDSGIGGRASEAVGAKLKRLSETNQVLCVTHQPQIARFADSHLLVQKHSNSNRTSVTVERLDNRGRVEELARMLTGARITDAARRHARELLK
jgi:DNA repair protein RecN (Recombination protein N)